MYSKPEIKASGKDDLATQVSALIRTAMMQMEGCMQARVVAVDRESGRVDVQPMIQAGTTDGRKVSRPVVPNLPIATLGAGDIFVSFPVVVGSLGFVIAGDRDASLFYQGEGVEDWPNTGRLHSFSDGFFLPLKLFNFNITEHAITDGLTIQTDDAETFITLKPGEIRMKASSIIIEGDIDLTGDIEQEGSIESSGDVVAGGISLIDHVHGGVEPGGGQTGPAE